MFLYDAFNKILAKEGFTPLLYFYRHCEVANLSNNFCDFNLIKIF